MGTFGSGFRPVQNRFNITPGPENQEPDYWSSPGQSPNLNPKISLVRSKSGPNHGSEPDRSITSHVRLWLPFETLQKLIVAMNEEYPILEYLILAPLKQGDTILLLPETLQAPHLRHLLLLGLSRPIGSQFLRILTTAVGLVTLCLVIFHPSTYCHPNTLLQWISFMPKLEILMVEFSSHVLNHDVERQLMRTPITTHVTLPNLHALGLRGAGTYMEAVVRHITPPCLEKLDINFLNQLTFSIPCLLQFMNTTENLSFSRAEFLFSDKAVYVEVYYHEEAKTYYALVIDVDCWHLDCQVSSTAQILNTLSQKFSAVEHLTSGHEVHSWSSKEHNEVDRTEWCKLLRSFSNVKTLSVDDGLVRELSCCLQLDDGELPRSFLPSCRSSHFQGLSMSMMRSPNSLMHTRTQDAP
ncbi:hypothetical protein F5888DRAFT_1638120 [Russula emetica]|nr:hypothetical protein F5888DRAFT_1638120 [Russula emetica]